MSAKWNGMAPCGIHGADFRGQRCDICAKEPQMIAHDAEECECCEKTHEARAEVERLKALLREVRENVRVTPHMGGEVSNPSIRDHKAMCEWVRRVARLVNQTPSPRDVEETP